MVKRGRKKKKEQKIAVQTRSSKPCPDEEVSDETQPLNFEDTEPGSVNSPPKKRTRSSRLKENADKEKTSGNSTARKLNFQGSDTKGDLTGFDADSVEIEMGEGEGFSSSDDDLDSVKSTNNNAQPIPTK